ncbi:MAG: T9SS type A sorting domain-containing protein, partial [Lewinella sp.]|nr:T9SS type A sorting domain-containing protein [Lewinella sp.]
NGTPGMARSVQLNRGEVTSVAGIDRPTLSLEVYPTVTHDQPVQVVIESDRPGRGQLWLTSSTGQVVAQRPLSIGMGTVTEQLDLHDLPAGRYFLSLRVGSQVLPARAVIKQ